MLGLGISAALAAKLLVAADVMLALAPVSLAIQKFIDSEDE